jgi:hypothetical protein
MFISNDDPRNYPAPPTLDEVAAHFVVPVMSFIAQPALEVLGVGTQGHSANGAPMELDSVSVSYTVWRYPEEHADPRNLAELSESEWAALNTPPVRPLPEWMLKARDRMQYPSLWEAVLTTRNPGRIGVPESRVGDAGAATSTSPSAATVLVHHVNHVLMNAFRDERVVGGFPGELDAPVNERHVENADVTVDGAPVAGLRIDTDPHVYAVGVDLGNRVLTAVVARDYLEFVEMSFCTR